jgi:hypothetical protein
MRGQDTDCGTEYLHNTYSVTAMSFVNVAKFKL